MIFLYRQKTGACRLCRKIRWFVLCVCIIFIIRIVVGDNFTDITGLVTRNNLALLISVVLLIILLYRTVQYFFMKRGLLSDNDNDNQI